MSQQALEVAYFSLFGVAAISIVIGLLLNRALLRHLEVRHADQWNALGRPSLFRNNTISNGLAVMRFLWSKRYRELRDSQLDRLVGYLVAFYWYYGALLLVGTVLFITSLRVAA